jgi:ribosomal protein S18 acetylase RimI-like enzyme
MQLGYLRGIQSADLRRRRTNPESKNEMLVARRVIPMDSPEVAQSTPLILDWNQIYNMEERIPKNKKTPTMDYVRGEILGFCEVTQRAYGLGDDDKPRRMQSARQFSASSVRPILTNLSVKDEARKSGIGSQLVEACEATVAQWETSNGNVPTEIILEVESDNEKALAFYKKRGYEEVFTDPACRRYTTSGFFLSKERCSKICMRKELSASGSSSSEQKAPAMDLSKMLQSIRENVFN